MIDTAVILAVGNLSHQSRLIYNRTRTMLPALGKPLVVRAMDRLYRIGIQNFIVVLGENEGSVASYLNSRWLPNVTIDFHLKLNSQPLGKALHSIATKYQRPFLLASYNSFTHMNFPERIRKFLELTPDDLILCGAKQSLSKSTQHYYAHISVEQEVGYSTEPTYAAERANLINTTPSHQNRNLILTNIAACGSNFIQYIATLPPAQQNTDRWMEVVTTYQQSGQTVRVARSSWVLQISTDSDLLTLNRTLLEEKIDAHILSEIPYTVQIKEPIRIDPRVSIGQGAVIGPHVYLERGSSVGHEANISNAIIMEGASVAANETIKDMIVYSRGRIPQ